MNQAGELPVKPPVIAAAFWLACAAMSVPAAEESALPQVAGCARLPDDAVKIAECETGAQRLWDWQRWLWWFLPPAEPPAEASVIYRERVAWDIAFRLHSAGYAPPPTDMAKLNEQWQRFERIKEIDHEAAMTIGAN